MRLHFWEMRGRSMFLDYFELREQPFAGPVDPAHSYRSRSYRQALSSLTEAVLGNRGNLLLLTAPGLGSPPLLEQILSPRVPRIALSSSSRNPAPPAKFLSTF